MPLRDIQEHCDTCAHSYMERENLHLRQKCDSTEYNNSAAYIHEMFMEDRGQGYCRFWTPKTRKG